MSRSFRLAASGDLHCRQEHHGRFREFVKAVNGEAEGLVLCGDLTDRGGVDEAKVLADSLSALPARMSCGLQRGIFSGCCSPDSFSEYSLALELPAC